MTEEVISTDLKDQKAKEITVNVPANDGEVAVELSNGILQIIVAAKKDFRIENDGASFLLKKNDVNKLWNEAKGDVTITIGKDDASAVKNAISDTYSIEIEKGFDENKEKLQEFKAKMDIVLPIDDAKLINEKKVAIYEQTADQLLKAKYKKGILTFDVKNTGSFTVVND